MTAIQQAVGEILLLSTPQLKDKVRLQVLNLSGQCDTFLGEDWLQRVGAVLNYTEGSLKNSNKMKIFKNGLICSAKEYWDAPKLSSYFGALVQCQGPGRRMVSLP